MRDRAYLDFVLARTLAHMEANPPILPLLGEAPARQPKACPKPGHEGLMVKRSDGSSRCIECVRERKAARRERTA